MTSLDKSKIQSFINFAKVDVPPDDICADTVTLAAIKEQYENRLVELKAWFWAEIDRQMMRR